MPQVHQSMSTGLPGLDRILQGVRPGDNIVWQVDSIDDYLPFVGPFCVEALREERPLVYFRFADHAQLVADNSGAEILRIAPEEGFESFISAIFDVIEGRGPGTCYVFDCLSELAADWYSDRMLGNFFMLTCPYLYGLETVTYFALLKSRHMPEATNAIHTTAQVVIDVYHNGPHPFVHPLKVYKRHSPTMYMLHAWDGEAFVPVTRSVIVSEILGRAPQPWLDFSVQRLDLWSRTFGAAQQILDARRDGSPTDAARGAELSGRLLRMAVTRDPRLLALAGQYLDLSDLVEIGRRMIGTGLIGGKSVGMLVARAILRKSAPQVFAVLEAHDSFYIGSDVFYTYLVVNNCWWVRRKLHNSGAMIDGSEEVRQRLLSGSFPRDMQDQFMDMLEYFGQSPIIVRSSSLLEDAYGNAFSGKYESVFCTNRGAPQERLDEFMAAVRTVYASTMRKEALAYRIHWGLLDRDEQMALLVQRVSGSMHGDLYFPDVAGVGFSFNPYAWNAEIDPRQGMIRLVFGLGTRAVDRHDDDYTRVVGLSAPLRRPESGFDEVRRYAQRLVDVMDLAEHKLVSRDFEAVAGTSADLPLDLFSSHDEELEGRSAERGIRGVFSRVLTFERLLSATDFVTRMKQVLCTLEEAYDYPVDIEFTANFIDDREFRINLLQCRPFQAKRETRIVDTPASIDPADLLLKTRGPIIGASVASRVDRLIYVVPAVYGTLPVNDRYAVARLVGRLAHAHEPATSAPPFLALVGPGRWGTTTPSLGVPVSVREISAARVVCEIAAMHEGLVPDVSLGTHFFNDLVEMDLLYLAIYPDRDGYAVNDSYLRGAPSRLLELAPDAAAWDAVVRVIDGSALGCRLLLNVNSVEQVGVCYVGRDAAKASQ